MRYKDKDNFGWWQTFMNVAIKNRIFHMSVPVSYAEDTINTVYVLLIRPRIYCVYTIHKTCDV
jgi:hypothetical protein